MALAILKDFSTASVPLLQNITFFAFGITLLIFLANISAYTFGAAKLEIFLYFFEILYDCDLIVLSLHT
jgi:hypothetical protein|tara:strand:+ start:809 stop:1015 length:207 start_codon:yes stop_codon:yes gene_type:complete